MAKLNWERARVYPSEAEQKWLSKIEKRTKRLKQLSPELEKIFLKAEERSKYTRHFGAVLSMKRQALIKGILSEKQFGYLKDLAGMVKKIDGRRNT